MNKNLKYFGYASMLTLTIGFASCSSDDNTVTPPPTPNPQTEAYVWGTEGAIKTCNHLLFTSGKEDANGTEIGNGDQEFIFKGKQTLKKGTYTLKGWIYIAEGSELTIEPGTIIKGDKATKASIIAERGGKLIAKGAENSPIVFTSAQPKGQRKPGDWGGIILCGKAQNNQTEQQIEGGPRTKHGGSDNADNSGILSYVRIEFAGYPFQKDKEINGLTLGSVGSGTTLDHIQVSYSNDDSYEWFGGTVNAKYLIAYHGWDDDFDTDNGYSGNVQFGLVVRDSRIADTSQSNSFESDNNASGSDVNPFTSATFSNITFVGPKMDASFKNNTDYINGGNMNPNNGSALGKFQAAMHIRRNSRLNCVNSLAIGYPIGLILDNEKGDRTFGLLAWTLSALITTRFTRMSSTITLQRKLMLQRSRSQAHSSTHRTVTSRSIHGSNSLTARDICHSQPVLCSQQRHGTTLATGSHKYHTSVLSAPTTHGPMAGRSSIHRMLTINFRTGTLV